ncbi:hypothetical protein [Gracilibacillus alcaliphilus]|uniref:hypothetical protein n=1 Tax=Gracilibacillus alcaliphilus TaxID=1401441 RepID=UPI0019592BA6|nr:hypothetical protein [Gracilibacillus alcaliphilus]
MTFDKKTWNFDDTPTEEDANRWEEGINEALKSIVPKHVTGDWNDITEDGIYHGEATMLNAPIYVYGPDSYKSSAAKVFVNTNLSIQGTVCVQLAVVTTLTGRVHEMLQVRYLLLDGTWSAWEGFLGRNEFVHFINRQDNPHGVTKEQIAGLNHKIVEIGENTTVNESTNPNNQGAIVIGRNAHVTMNSISIGRNSTTNNYNSVAIGYDSEGNGTYSTSLGYYSVASGSGTALGRSAKAIGSTSVALGGYSIADGTGSVAIGRGSHVINSGEGVLGVSNTGATPGVWTVPGSFSVGGSKNFEIPHPKPEKSATHRIRHGAVESPTAGDTLYRYTVKATDDNDVQYIDLPDYFIYLNKDVQIFVTPQGHFSNGYGVLNRETEQLEIHCQSPGEYNVIVIGTRNDYHQSIQEWDIRGVEREIGESWAGETYAFSVDEIVEVEEIKEAE